MMLIYLLLVLAVLMRVGCTTLSTGAGDSIYKDIEALEDEIFKLIRRDELKLKVYNLMENRICPDKLPKNPLFQQEFHCLDIKGRCYCSINIEKSWWGALHFCRQYGMELLSLETQQEATDFMEDFVRGRFHNVAYFTSGTLIHGDRTSWLWEGTGVLFTNISWAPGEPSGTSENVKEDCINIQSHDGKTHVEPRYNDLNCEKKEISFICELELAPKSL